MRVSPRIATSPPPTGRAAFVAPATVLLAALLLYFLRFGYAYASSDQDEFIPLLLHRIDPTLFTDDWFVQIQSASFGIRTCFVLFLQGLSLFMPVWLAVLLVYVASWLLIAAAVYALVHALMRDSLAASASVVTALVLTPLWTLGGNDLVHRMLVPSMPAWGLGLWGAYAFLRRHPVVAGGLLGLATWMQALVGLQLFGLLVLVTLLGVLTNARRRASLRHGLLLGGAYFAFTLPVLIPLVLLQAGAPPPPTASGPSRFYIQALFRNPHHYLFFSFPPGLVLRFSVLTASGLAAFTYLHRRRSLHHAGFIGASFASVAILGFGAFLFGEVFPVLTIAQLQLFKATVFAKVLLVALIWQTLLEACPRRARRWMQHVLSQRRVLVLTIAAWGLVLAGTQTGWPFLRKRVFPLSRLGTPQERVEAWARTQTPRDAVFAVPPSWDAFRSHARRAIVVNFKAFPFDEGHMARWFDRLTTLAPIMLPQRGGGSLISALDSAYARQPAATLRPLADRYAFQYVIRPAPLASPGSSFELVFTAEPWRVYRVRRPSSSTP